MNIKLHHGSIVRGMTNRNCHEVSQFVCLVSPDGVTVLDNGLVVCLDDDDRCHVQRGWPNTQTEKEEAEYQASQWPVTRLQIFLMIKLVPMVIRIKALLKVFTVLSVCVTGRTALVS